jgi:hypothetical protein
MSVKMISIAPIQLGRLKEELKKGALSVKVNKASVSVIEIVISAS